MKLTIAEYNALKAHIAEDLSYGIDGTFNDGNDNFNERDASLVKSALEKIHNNLL